MIKKLRLLFIVIFSVTVIVIWFCNFWIEHSTQYYVYDNVEDIPYNKVGILLGTTKSLESGEPNPFFYYRIEAAIALYKAKKVDKIVASGDNRTKYYNETKDMRGALLKGGVPDSVIISDFAGLRTFDSMIRIKKIFGQTNITVISQEFHNQRAIYIARRYGIEAIGYNAADVDFFKSFGTHLREKLARVKVFIDIALNISPKHLGEKIDIE